jgi:hypothetical protein
MMLSRLVGVGYGCDRNIAVLKHQPADQHISIKPRMAEKMSLTGTGLKAERPRWAYADPWPQTTDKDREPGLHRIDVLC